MTRIIGGSILGAFVLGMAASSASAQLEAFVVKGVVMSITRTDGASAWTSQIAVGDSFEYNFLIDLNTPRLAIGAPLIANYQISSSFGSAGPISYQSTDHSGPLVDVPPDLGLYKDPTFDLLSANSYVTVDGVNPNDVTSVFMSLAGPDPALSDLNIPTHLALNAFVPSWIELSEIPFTGPGLQFSDFEADVAITSLSIVSTATPVPESTTYGLAAAVGLLGMIGWRRFGRGR